jgi:hypothetical protein
VPRVKIVYSTSTTKSIASSVARVSVPNDVIVYSVPVTNEPPVTEKIF